MADSPISGQGFTVEQLFSGRRYGLDYYQREYTWSREDVSDLLADLYKKFIASWREGHDRAQTAQYEPYFLGPFVYHEEAGVTYLVDGQQRITTLHLLLIYIHQLLQEQDHKEDADHLLGLICTFRFGERTFTVNVPERRDLLDAFLKQRDYEPPADASPSLRTLWERCRDLDEDFPEELRGPALPYFYDWLLSRVCLVGIKARNRDHGWEIFESMNDRGVRLGPMDLLKGFLLSHSSDRHGLNKRWREMLGQLAVAVNAPSDFVKAFLVGRYADVSEGSTDVQGISTAFHEWLRLNADRLQLKRPADFNRFIGLLTKLAPRYRALLGASRELVAGLEPVFYNAYNGLSNQVALILASLEPDGGEAAFKQKSRLVAAFLDLLYVRRIVHNKPVSELNSEILQYIPLLRECQATGPEQLARRLGAVIAGLEDDLSGIATFALRPDNRRQVRYLLARMTAYVQVGCGEPHRVAEYLDEQRPYEVEHVWANKFERYQAEARTYEEFQRWRNRLGALLLLPKSDNASYRDDTYERKVEYYLRQDHLAASLHPAAYKKNPRFLKFIKQEQLEPFFEGFASSFGKEEINKRQRLYQRLCERIWDPERLGFIVPRVREQAEQRVRRRTRARYNVSLPQLLKAGLLSVGDELVGKRKGKAYTASVGEGGRITLPTGEVFYSLSAAGGFVLQGKACNGWELWHVRRPQGLVSLKEIRNEALRRGLLEQEDSEDAAP